MSAYDAYFAGRLEDVELPQEQHRPRPGGAAPGARAELRRRGGGRRGHPARCPSQGHPVGQGAGSEMSSPGTLSVTASCPTVSAWLARTSRSRPAAWW
jgi:hypothetical protein